MQVCGCRLNFVLSAYEKHLFACILLHAGVWVSTNVSGSRYDKAVGVGFMVRGGSVKCGGVLLVCGGYDKAVGVGFIHGEGENVKCRHALWRGRVPGEGLGGEGGRGFLQQGQQNGMGSVRAWSYAQRSLLSTQLPFLQTLAACKLCFECISGADL